MSFRITCYTLFDITQTGVLNRAKPSDGADIAQWVLKRNSQANFDTVLQVINLRSQPDVVRIPNKGIADTSMFGTALGLDSSSPCWTFKFDIQHRSVFNDGKTELGSLYNDCDKVPMILCGTEHSTLPACLDISPEFRNIYFSIDNE